MFVPLREVRAATGCQFEVCRFEFCSRPKAAAVEGQEIRRLFANREIVRRGGGKTGIVKCFASVRTGNPSSDTLAVKRLSPTCTSVGVQENMPVPTSSVALVGLAPSSA